MSRVLRREHEELLLHTGQHYDDALSDVFFRELGVPDPDVMLGVGSGEACTRLAAMIRGVRATLDGSRFDWVLVYGDTDSTLAAALAAHEAGVRVAHVEAGLRSGDRSMPEEINRIATDHLSTLLLTPTSACGERLRSEHASGAVVQVGDVMLDVSLTARDRVDAFDVTDAFGVTPGEFLVATVHRPVNTDDPARLPAIVRAFDSLRHPVLLACHPRTRAALRRFGVEPGERLRLIEPQPYIAMAALVRRAHAVLTDSGGLQKEALWLGTPCVTLRETTEWTETVDAGWNRLVGADPERIRTALHLAPAHPGTRSVEAFGDGRAAEQVVQALVSSAAS